MLACLPSQSNHFYVFVSNFDLCAGVVAIEIDQRESGMFRLAFLTNDTGYPLVYSSPASRFSSDSFQPCLRVFSNLSSFSPSPPSTVECTMLTISPFTSNKPEHRAHIANLWLQLLAEAIVGGTTS